MEQQTVKKHSMLAKAFTTMLVAFLWITLPSAAQTVVRGIVTDAAGDFLPGVSVQVIGSPKVGSVTDINGAYSIKANGKDVLVFSYVGMKQQKVKIGGRNLVNVTMQEDASTLTDVVVVGYGTVKKQSLTGAVSAMRGDELLKVLLRIYQVSSVVNFPACHQSKCPVSQVMTRLVFVFVVPSMRHFT